MTTMLSSQNKMIEHLIATANETAKTTGNTLILCQETDQLFIIASTEDHHATNLFTATRAQLMAAVEQWSQETIKHWDTDLPCEPFDSAQAVASQRWEDVVYDGETAEVVLEFTGEIAAIPSDPFWATVAQYLNTVRVTKDAETVTAITRAMFQEDQPSNPEHAFFPGSGGNEQLLEALSDAGWSFTYIDGGYHYIDGGYHYIDGGYHYIAIAPNGTKLAYIEGDIELEPVENQPNTIDLTVDLDMWRMLDTYVANREALAEAEATGNDTDPISETVGDLANGSATAVLNAAAEG